MSSATVKGFINNGTIFLKKLVFPVIYTFNLKLCAKVIDVSERYFCDSSIGVIE